MKKLLIAILLLFSVDAFALGLKVDPAHTKSMTHTGNNYTANTTACMLFTIATTSSPETFTLPIAAGGAGYSHNFTVQWGDGQSSTVTSYNDADAAHSYATAGTYQVRMTGTCEWFKFNNGGSKLNMRSLDHLSYDPGFKILEFYGCSNLARIDNSFGDRLVALTTAQNMFSNCTLLKSIPQKLFWKSGTKISASGFLQAFANCTSLTAIPTDLFRYNTAVSTSGFYEAFISCTSLTAIPTDLFRYNTAVSTSGFYKTFTNCTSLTAIPTDLFRYNTAVSTSGFYSTFQSCTSLTTIPTDLFRYNTAVSTSGFYTTFSNCTSLTTIPTDLFRYNTAVSTSGFAGTFSSCSSLASLPTDLFRYNTAVSTSGFLAVFRYCNKLTQNSDIFFKDGEYVIVANVQPATAWEAGDTITGQTSGATCVVVEKLTTWGAGIYAVNTIAGTPYTDGEIIGVTGNADKLADQNAGAPLLELEKDRRFLATSAQDFSLCFDLNASFSGAQGTAPALWDCTFGSAPTTTDCFDGHDASSLTNFASIPAGWK